MSHDGSARSFTYSGVVVWRRVRLIAEIEGRIHVMFNYFPSKRADKELIHLLMPREAPALVPIRTRAPMMQLARGEPAISDVSSGVHLVCSSGRTNPGAASTAALRKAPYCASYRPRRDPRLPHGHIHLLTMRLVNKLPSGAGRCACDQAEPDQLPCLLHAKDWPELSTSGILSLCPLLAQPTRKRSA